MTRSEPSMQPMHVALSMSAHDRVGARRTDDAWLAEVWADPATRVLPLAGARFPVTTGGDGAAWRRPYDASADPVPDGQRVFLGMRDGRAHFALLVEQPDEDWVSFRQVGPALEPHEAGLVVHAVALAEWHRAHRFCPRCGAPLDTAAAGHVLTCTGCGRQHFPRTDPAVIMLVTDGDRCLLGRQPSWPPGRFSSLAGFVDPGESLEQAVVREVAEEVGVRVDEVTYFGNQPWPFPASLMIGFFARAVTTRIHVDGEEITDARWFTRPELLAGAESGQLVLPGRVSISRSLIEHWYGGVLPGQW